MGLLKTNPISISNFDCCSSNQFWTSTHQLIRIKVNYNLNLTACISHHFSMQRLCAIIALKVKTLKRRIESKRSFTVQFAKNLFVLWGNEIVSICIINHWTNYLQRKERETFKPHFGTTGASLEMVWGAQWISFFSSGIQSLRMEMILYWKACLIWVSTFLGVKSATLKCVFKYTPPRWGVNLDDAPLTQNRRVFKE